MSYRNEFNNLLVAVVFTVIPAIVFAIVIILMSI